MAKKHFYLWPRIVLDCKTNKRHIRWLSYREVTKIRRTKWTHLPEIKDPTDVYWYEYRENYTGPTELELAEQRSRELEQERIQVMRNVDERFEELVQAIHKWKHIS